MPKVESHLGRYNTVLFIICAALCTSLAKVIFMQDQYYMAMGSSGVCFAYLTFYALQSANTKFYVPVVAILPVIGRYVIAIPPLLSFAIVLAFLFFFRLRLPIWLIAFLFILDEIPGASLQALASKTTGGTSPLGHLGGVVAGIVAFYWLDFQSLKKTFGKF